MKNNQYNTSLIQSIFKADYIGFFSDRTVESLIAQMHGWQNNGVDEERELLISMKEMLTIVENEISN